MVIATSKCHLRENQVYEFLSGTAEKVKDIADKAVENVKYHVSHVVSHITDGSAIEKVQNIAEEAVKEVKHVGSHLTDGSAIEKVKDVADKAVKEVQHVGSHITDGSAIEKVKDLADKAVKEVEHVGSHIVEVPSTAVVSIKHHVSHVGSHIEDASTSAVLKVKTFTKDNIEKAKNFAEDAFETSKDGLHNLAHRAWDSGVVAIEKTTGVITTIKNFIVENLFNFGYIVVGGVVIIAALYFFFRFMLGYCCECLGRTCYRKSSNLPV